jgi:tRNA modification GTPase
VVATAPVLLVRTKSDLRQTLAPDSASAADGAYLTSGPVLDVSAETGAGLRELVAAIESSITSHHGGMSPELPLVLRARQQRALGEAREEVARFRERWSSDELPAPVAAVHIRAAIHALETLVGVVSLDDVLDRLFSAFCVGK